MIELCGKLETKQKITDWIDQTEDKIVKLTQELISIPSDNPPGDCYDIAEFLERRLKEFGFDNTQMLNVDHGGPKRNNTKRTVNILTVQNFGEGKAPEVVLNAHGDVVPPGRGWTHDPYGGDIVDNKIYGRGAAVSKSDISAYTYAVLALKEIAADELSGKVDLAFTFDEQSGGLLGPKWLLQQQFIKPQMAFTSGFTHSILNAHNGALHAKITVSGKSAHATTPELGKDALEVMTHVMQALYDYQKELKNRVSAVRGIKSPTLTIGMINGGTSTNVVPDECEILIDRRLIPEEDGIQVEAEIAELVKKVCAPFTGIEVEIERVMLANTFGPISEETPIIQALSENWKVLFPDQELKIGGIPLYADARHFSEAGIPTVMYGAGPRTLAEANGYQADENLQISDLMQATKVIALTLFDLLDKGK